MRHIVAFIAVFVLFSVLTSDVVSAAPLEWDVKETVLSLPPSFFSDQLAFSTDVDIFLGQKKRRRNGGGRVWSNLYYADTTLKPKEGGKIQPDVYGFQVGFDVAKSHGVHSTFFANVNQSKINFSGVSSKIDNYLLGGGKFFYLNGCHFAFTACVGYDRYEISAGSTCMGDGLQTNFFGEFGLDFIFGKWGIKPFYALQYDFLYHGRIGNSPVLLSDWNGHGLNQLVGLRLNWRIMDMLELQGRAVWVHEMLDNPPPFYRARFSPVHGTSTPAVMFYEGYTGRDWAWLGFGAKFECIFNVYLFLDYDLLINERHTTHLGSLGFCLGW